MFAVMMTYPLFFAILATSCTAMTCQKEIEKESSFR